MIACEPQTGSCRSGWLLAVCHWAMAGLQGAQELGGRSALLWCLLWLAMSGWGRLAGPLVVPCPVLTLPVPWAAPVRRPKPCTKPQTAPRAAGSPPRDAPAPWAHLLSA